MGEGRRRGQRVALSTASPPVQVTVVVPRLSSLAAGGSGDLRFESFETPALQVSLSGSGEVKLPNLRTGELGIRTSGSGDVGYRGDAVVRKSVVGSGSVTRT